MAAPELKENYLRPQQIQDLKQDIESCDRQLGNANPLEQVDRRKVAMRRRRLQHDLDSQSPPVLGETERVALERERDSLEETLRKKMPPRDIMMRNPSGAVGKNMAFEKRYKKDVRRWKTLQVVLNQDSDDPDIANAERLRPDTDNLVNYADAQIPPKIMSIPSPQFQQNYENVQWDGEAEALKEELRIKLEKLEALATKLEARVRVPRKKGRRKKATRVKRAVEATPEEG